MSKIQELPTALQQKIEGLLTQGGIALRGGDKKKCIEYCLIAWNLIPEPKEHWMMYPQTISINLANEYANLNEQAEFKKWIDIAFEMYHSPEKQELYVLKTEGEGYYKMQNYDEAYRVYHKIFELYGRKAFPGEDLKYYKFMMEYEAKHK